MLRPRYPTALHTIAACAAAALRVTMHHPLHALFMLLMLLPVLVAARPRNPAGGWEGPPAAAAS